MRHSLSVAAVFAATLLVCLVGCGEITVGVPIQGEVTYQDKPLSEGTISFFPTKGRPTMAVLDHYGSYECRLPAGDYRVTIAIGVKLPAGWKEGDSVPQQSVTLPPKYSSRVRTPLSATVSPGQGASLDFALE